MEEDDLAEDEDEAAGFSEDEDKTVFSEELLASFDDEDFSDDEDTAAFSEELLTFFTDEDDKSS